MKHYFQTPNPDLLAIQKRLVVWFKQSEFEVDAADVEGEYFIQARKGGSMRAFLGTSQAFLIKMTLTDEPNEFVYESTIGAWSANLTGAGIAGFLTGGITWGTAALGAAWTAKVERDIVEFLETSLRFRKMKSVTDTGEIIDGPGAAPQVDLSDKAVLSAVRGAALRVLSPTVPIPSPAPSQTSPVSPSGSGTSPISSTTPSPSLSAAEYAIQKAQAELQKLEAAHQAGVLTEQELASKKNDLQAKTIEWEVQFVVDEKAAKLKGALEHGLLEQHEYESKLAALEPIARQEILTKRNNQLRDTQISKLKSALDAGVLTEDEYAAKVTALG